jgi:hypothetical protein
MKALKFQELPDPWDFDNARYLLWECSGGYPIGIFSAYVRSPIAERGEGEQSQLFLVVGFNFFGRQDWPRIRLVSKLWEKIHDRATANILNRFKQVCEMRFQQVLEGKQVS